LAATAAEALLLKAHLLEPQQELDAFEELIRRFGHRDEADVASQVAWAMWSKGGCLEKRGGKEDALAIYEEVRSRFGHRQEPSFPDLIELVDRDIQRLTGGA
jgi:hypothetical protein